MRDSHDDAARRLQDRSLAEAVSSLEAEEEAARRAIEDEYAALCDSLENDERERRRIAVNRMKSRVLEEQLEVILQEEVEARGKISKEESSSIKALSKEEASKRSALYRRKSSVGVKKLESRKVKGSVVVVTETESNISNSVHNLVPQSKVVAGEVSEEDEGSTTAVNLLQRVGRGYRCRKLLHARIVNRRVNEAEVGMKSLIKEEFETRIKIAGDCVHQLNDILFVYKHSAPLLANTDSFSVLMKEEESFRKDLESEYEYNSSVLSRLEGKHRLNSSEGLLPSKSNTVDSTLSAPSANLPFVTLNPTPHQRESYRGFELDELGSFLIHYEADLQKLKKSIAEKRQLIAAEHDRLKERRDTASNDIHRGGTGASWVPSRPLPLSDLVRGPTVQYKR
ncbi:hypothetical protein AGDE_16535 [Angomonas deanei]|nr:hypothetical protein AGDE_16535 [Angomonas deanei]|eukprot:EPY16920.1 hypothetical protein AGDE_16535 [Angomonas deanei]